MAFTSLSSKPVERAAYAIQSESHEKYFCKRSCLLDRQEILAKDDNSLKKKQDEHLPPEQQTADDNSLKKDGTQM